MEESFHICLEEKFLNESKCVCIVLNFWNLRGAVGKLVSMAAAPSDHVHGFWPHFHRQKYSHKGQPPPLKFSFLNLFSTLKPFLSKKKKKKKKKSQKLLLSHEIDATWFQSPKIT